MRKQSTLLYIALSVWSLGCVLLVNCAHAQTYNNVTITGGGSLKGDGTNNLSSAASSDITALWSGTCNASSFLRGDGSCAAPSGGVPIPGTSGGIIYYSSTTTLASSGLLTANALVLGGGAGSTPFSLGSLGTATTVLHGNVSGVPSYSSVNLATDISGTLPAGNFPALTGECVTTAGSLNVTCLQLLSLTGNIQPAAAPTTTSQGRNLTISAGQAGSTSGAGGGLTLVGGGVTSGPGGQVILKGAGGGGGASSGGGVTMLGGLGSGTGAGGDFNMTGGGGGATGRGGNVNVAAGGSGLTSGNGGALAFQGGNALNVGNGGNASFFAGSGGNTSGAGGSILLQAGFTNDATSLGGGITIVPGSGADPAHSGSILLQGGFDNFNVGVIDAFDNAVFACTGTTNTTDTNGYVYLPDVSGVPTGVPANLTGAYATSTPFRYDTTDNRLYAYNSGWKNVASGAYLTGTTGSIGGGALLAGACTSGTVSISGVTTAMGIVVTPVTYPGDGTDWKGYVSAANTVTVKVCGLVAVTPVASTYNVRAIL